MNTSTLCPCCSTPLLHHFSNRREYWFCRHCWTEMPTFETNKSQENGIRIVNLSAKLPIRNHLVLVS